MKSPLLALCLSVPVSAVTFEKLTIDHAGSEHPATAILSVDPLVMDAFEPIEDSFFLSHLVWGNNGPSPHVIYDSYQPPAPGETASSQEAFATADGGGNFFLLSTLKIGGVSRADAFIQEYDGAISSEYVPRAKATLANGETHRFGYSLFGASNNGVLGVLGVDDRFNHFVLRATQDNVEIIAQESVTDFPGGSGKFTRFANRPNVSPDGSIIAFRGQESGGHTGLFTWTATDGIRVVGDSNATLPDGVTPWGNLESSSSAAVFGSDNTLYIKHAGSGTLLMHKSGVTSEILSNGDLINGTPVAQLTSFDSNLDGLKPLPNGDLLFVDNNRMLIRSESVWSELIHFTQDLPQNHSYRGSYWITPQHAYFTYSIYDPGANVESQYVVRIDYEGGGIEGVYQFDSAEVNGELTSIREVRVGGDNLVIGYKEHYFATQLSTLPDVDVSVAPPTTFSSFVADLPVDQRGEDDDPDFDRLSNLVEFALKLDPSTANSLADGFTLSVLPAASVGLPGEALHVRLEVNVHPEAEGFTVTPRRYVELAGPASPVDAIEAYGSPLFHLGRHVQLYRSPTPIGDLQAAFFRLEVTLDE